MKVQRMEHSRKPVAALAATLTLLAGCAKAERALSDEALQVDRSITSLREAPESVVAPETEHTRGSKCAIAIARVAVDEVLRLVPEDASRPGTYHVDTENMQSSYVRVLEPSEGVSTLKLQVALNNAGEAMLTGNEDIRYAIGGEISFMQTSQETWQEAFVRTRDDQVGYPNGGIRALNLKTGEGGSSDAPESMCSVADQLR